MGTSLTRAALGICMFASMLASATALAATPAATVAAFHAALKAGDRDGALALLAPGVTIYEAGHVERSRDEYASHHLASDAAFSKATVRKVLRQHERMDGALALVMEETETTGTFKDKAVHMLGTESMVLEKAGDGWLIVHAHWSSRKAPAAR